MNNTAKMRGFTLIEILVAVGILGVLSAIAVMGYRHYIDRARAADIIEKFDAVRTRVGVTLTQITSQCADIARQFDDKSLANQSARLSINLVAAEGGPGAGWRPVMVVCARADRHGQQGVSAAREAHKVFSNNKQMESGAVLTESVVSFAVPLSQGKGSQCAVPFGATLDACGDPVAVPTAAAVKAPGQAPAQAIATPTPQAVKVPTPVPMVTAVDLMRNISGATSLSAFAGEQRGVPLGTQLVGLYLAGSNVNQLAAAKPPQLPRVTSAYTSVGDAGYQYLDGSGALGRLMPSMADNLHPLAPSERNAWDGGIAIFSDGTVARMQKACNGNTPEKDYVYFSVLSGVSANQGMAIVRGTAAPSQSVRISSGNRVLATVRADAQGNWNFAGPASLAQGGQTLNVVAAPTTP